MFEAFFYQAARWVSSYIGWENTLALKEMFTFTSGILTGFLFCFFFICWLFLHVKATPEMADDLNQIYMRHEQKTRVLTNPKSGVDLIDSFICLAFSLITFGHKTVYYKSHKRVRITLLSLLGLLLIMLFLSFQVYTVVLPN